MKIELRNATRRYKKSPVFSDIDLTIPAGELVAVVGDNGQGKTTLLETIYGLQALDEGELLWNDQVFNRHNIDLRRKAFYMPDRPPLSPMAFGIDEIARFHRIWDAGSEESLDLAIHLLEEFNVTEQAGKRASSLSRGEFYKVALAGLISVQADLWILDEPLASGMDTKGLTVLKRCCHEAVTAGKTVIYSTQLDEIAANFSTRVYRVIGDKITLEPNSK